MPLIIPEIGAGVKFGIPPFVNYTVIGFSAEDSLLYPAVNVADEALDSEWHDPNGGGTGNIVLDLGASYTNPVFFVFGVNISQIQFQGNSSNTWTSPLYSQIVDVPFDTRVVVRRIWYSPV